MLDTSPLEKEESSVGGAGLELIASNARDYKEANKTKQEKINDSDDDGDVDEEEDNWDGWGNTESPDPPITRVFPTTGNSTETPDTDSDSSTGKAIAPRVFASSSESDKIPLGVGGATWGISKDLIVNVKSPVVVTLTGGTVPGAGRLKLGVSRLAPTTTSVTDPTTTTPASTTIPTITTATVTNSTLESGLAGPVAMATSRGTPTAIVPVGKVSNGDYAKEVEEIDFFADMVPAGKLQTSAPTHSSPNSRGVSNAPLVAVCTFVVPALFVKPDLGVTSTSTRCHDNTSVLDIASSSVGVEDGWGDDDWNET